MEEEKKPRFKIGPEMLVGISAVVIGVCALFVSLYETQLMREEQRASVLPIMELSRSFYFEEDEAGNRNWRLKMIVENVGIGPGRVQEFTVTVDGQAYPTWRDAFRAVLGDVSSWNFVQSTINGRTIPVERQVVIVEVNNNDHAIAVGKAMDEGRFDFEACFCSVFDDCWTASFQSDLTRPESIAACARDDDSFQQ